MTFHEGTTGVVDLSAVTPGSELGIYEPLKNPRTSPGRASSLAPSSGRTEQTFCLDARADPPVEDAVCLLLASEQAAHFGTGICMSEYDK